MNKTGVQIPLAITLTVQSIVSMVAVTVPVLAPSAAPDIGVSATSVGLYVSLLYVGGMLSSSKSYPLGFIFFAVLTLVCGIGVTASYCMNRQS